MNQKKLTKEIYLKKKDSRREISPERDLCLSCFRPKKNCFCPHIRPFDPEIKILLLMHPMELKRERVGTGRLCHLTLKNSEIIMGVDFTLDKRLNELLNDPTYFPALLYPGTKSLNISSGDFSKKNLGQKKLLLILIDGTWPCAKKMMRLSKNLHSLLRVSFSSNKTSLFAIKEQPADFCLSTIEAIYEFLNSWEKSANASYEGKQEALMEVFLQMIKFQEACANDPNKKSYRKKIGYSKKEERRASKRFESRKIFFDR